MNKYISNMLFDRRFLHKNPECGFDTPIARHYIINELIKSGYSPRVIGRGGIIADIGDGKDGYTLLRADIDALPIKEETELDFKSNNGNMHACGHDMHTAILLAVARALKGMENKLTCSVRLFFQPAEEILAGATDAIENHLLKGVKRAFMLHVLPHIGLNTGTIIIPSGGFGAPCARFYRIILQGFSAHSATPDAGRNVVQPIAEIALKITNELNTLNPQLIHSIGRLLSGNGANIIPDRAIIEGTIRSMDQELTKIAIDKIKDITKKISNQYGVKHIAECFASCPPLYNNPTLSRFAQNILSLTSLSFINQEKLSINGKSLGGSEDFSYIAEQVPSLMLGIVAGTKPGIPLHNPNIEFDENVMPIGAQALLSLAIENDN